MTTQARTAAYTFDRIPAKARELLPVIGPTPYAVLGCLAAFADRDGKCWPSIETLVRMSGMSRATIRRSLKVLERYGVLSLQRRTKAGHEKLNDTNVYLIAYQACESPGWVVSHMTLRRVTSDARGRVTSEPGVGSPMTPEPDPLNKTQGNQTHRTTSDAAKAAGDETKEAPDSSKKKKAEASPEDTKLAQWFWERRLEVLPEQSKPNLAKWANAFRLMRERDGRKPDRIREVAAWAIADPFWTRNIQCPEKLREKFDRLIGQMGSSPTNGKSKYTGANSLFSEHKEGTHGDF